MSRKMVHATSALRSAGSEDELKQIRDGMKIALVESEKQILDDVVKHHKQVLKARAAKKAGAP